MLTIPFFFAAGAACGRFTKLWAIVPLILIGAAVVFTAKYLGGSLGTLWTTIVQFALITLVTQIGFVAGALLCARRKATRPAAAKVDSLA